MSTLCLCDMGELRDDWLREPRPARVATPAPGAGLSRTGFDAVRIVETALAEAVASAQVAQAA